jgi:hypothetical protein
MDLSHFTLPHGNLGLDRLILSPFGIFWKEVAQVIWLEPRFFFFGSMSNLPSFV